MHGFALKGEETIREIDQLIQTYESWANSARQSQTKLLLPLQLEDSRLNLECETNGANLLRERIEALQEESHSML